MSIANAINRLPIGFKLPFPGMLALAVVLGASARLTATKSGDIARDLALQPGQQQASDIGSGVEKAFGNGFGTLSALREAFIELRNPVDGFIRRIREG